MGTAIILNVHIGDIPFHAFQSNAIGINDETAWYVDYGRNLQRAVLIFHLRMTASIVEEQWLSNNRF